MTQEPQGHAAAFDPARVKETSDGDVAFERELFEAYIADCEERLARLERSVSAGEAEPTRIEAHSIKGASLNVGTTRLQDLAFTLEKTNAAEAPAAAREALVAVQAEFVRVRAALEAYLAAQS